MLLSSGTRPRKRRGTEGGGATTTKPGPTIPAWLKEVYEPPPPATGGHERIPKGRVPAGTPDADVSATPPLKERARPPAARGPRTALMSAGTPPHPA